MDPPMTRAPGLFSTGMDSPVMRLSSHVELPTMTFPSTGTLDPGIKETVYEAILNSLKINN
jgi:hypothetical protein